MLIFKFLFKIFLAGLFFCEMAMAQLPSLGGGGSMRDGAEFFAGRIEGKPLIKIHLVGGVHNPGVYHVPIDTNIAEALSYAGGAVEGASLEEIHVRSILGSKIDFKTYNFLDISKKRESYPSVTNGDIIQIDVQKDQLARTALWVSVLGAITSMALAALAYERSK